MAHDRREAQLPLLHLHRDVSAEPRGLPLLQSHPLFGQQLPALGVALLLHSLHTPAATLRLLCA